MINWRSLNAPPDKQLVKGTMLAGGWLDGLPLGQRFRFGIYEVRTREADGFPGVTHEVRDADGVTLTETAEGKWPPVVFRHDDAGECEKWVRAQLTNTEGK